MAREDVAELQSGQTHVVCIEGRIRLNILRSPVYLINLNLQANKYTPISGG